VPTRSAVHDGRGLNDHGEAEKARQYAERAIEINPQGFFGYPMLAANLNVAGTPEEAIDASTQAWRLGRHEPLRYDIANDLVWSHYMIRTTTLPPPGDSEPSSSTRCTSRPTSASPPPTPSWGVSMGRDRTSAESSSPAPTSAWPYRTRILYRDDEHEDHIVEGLLKAGLPQ
jgi:hypothetical protein